MSNKLRTKEFLECLGKETSDEVSNIGFSQNQYNGKTIEQIDAEDFWNDKYLEEREITRKYLER